MIKFDALFFDMDGTLVDHSSLMSAAFRQAFANQGLPIQTNTKKTSGCTDWEILELYLNQFPELTEERKKELEEIIAADIKVIINQMLESEGLKALPGAPELIKKLVELKIYPGLLTGNMEDIVAPKLEAAGMSKTDFSYGGFGDHSPKRVIAANKAMASAASFFGHPIEPSRALVIGDTPNDIACAHAIGAAVLAVPTGRFTKDQLLEHDPDFLLDDLRDIDGFLNIIGYEN